MKNQIDLSVFSVTRDAVVLDDGRVFRKAYFDVIDHDTESLNTNVRDDFAKHIQTTAQTLKSKGILFWFVLIPHEYRLFPERFPPDMQRNLHRSMRTTEILNQMARGNQASNNLFTVDLLSLLKASQEKELYLYGDHHFNGVGGTLANREVINRLAKVTNTDLQWSHPFKVISSPSLEAENNSLPLLTRFRPQVFDRKVEKTWAKCAQVDRGEYEGIEVRRTPDPNIEHTGIRLQSKVDLSCKPVTLPKTFIVGDSFFNYWPEWGVTEYFSDLTVINHEDLKEVLQRKTVSTSGTKVFMIYLFEGNFSPLLTDDWWRDFEKLLALF